MGVLRRLSRPGSKDQVPGVRVLGALLLTLAAPLLHAQQAKATATTTFIATPFDVAAQQLPAGFKGHNCAALAARVKALATKKSEFESTTDYEARMSTAKSSPIFAKLSANDTLAFVLNSGAAEMKYDADAGIATFELSEIMMHVDSLVVVGSKNHAQAFTVQQLSEVRRPFVGVNAFGRQVQAESVKRSVCAIAVTNMSRGRLSLYSQTSAKLPPAAARVAKENLGALIVGRLVPPLYHDAFTARTAKIDSPVELSVDGPALPLDLAELWYFNRRTGEILAKVEPQREADKAYPSPSMINTGEGEKKD